MLITAAFAESTANAEATATISAIAGASIEGQTLHWSYNGDPTGGKVTLKRGTTTIDVIYITNKGPGELSLVGFRTAENESLSATIAAGGAGVIGTVSISAKPA